MKYYFSKQNGTTALIVASTKGKGGFVRELLAHGADPNAEDNDSWTALLCASKEGHYDIVLQLLEHNAEIDHRDMVGIFEPQHRFFGKIASYSLLGRLDGAYVGNIQRPYQHRHPFTSEGR